MRARIMRARKDWAEQKNLLLKKRTKRLSTKTRVRKIISLLKELLNARADALDLKTTEEAIVRILERR